MENTEIKRLTLAQKLRKLYAQLRNMSSSIRSKEFREFRTLEYGNVQPEDLTNVERLKYLRDLDLAKNGYINNNLAKLIEYHKMKDQLIKTDMEVFRVGSIKVRESEILLTTIHIGYNEKLNGISLASSSHDNILKWKALNMTELVQKISSLYPTNQDSLQFNHKYFYEDVNKTFADISEKITEEYKNIVLTSFNANKYFENGVRKLNLNILDNPSEQIGQAFSFPLPYRGHEILRLTEANDNYLVFQPFLDALPTSDTFHFTHDDIKQLHFDTHIEKISKLKHDLVLGVKDGELFIGIKEANSKHALHWYSFKEALSNKDLPSKVKYYLSKEVIDRKNFHLEKGSIELKNGNLSGYLKRHYGTNEWHYAQSYNGNSNDLSFRPIWDTFDNYIHQNFENDQNKIVALKIANEVAQNNHFKESKIEIKL